MKNFKAFIFTVDAVFALVVASAAASILLYMNFVFPAGAQIPTLQAQSLLQGAMSLKLGNALASGIVPKQYMTPFMLNGANGSAIARFNNSRQSYVQVINSPYLQLGTLTITGWVNFSGPAASTYDWMVAKKNAWGVGACGAALNPCFINWLTTNTYSSPNSLSRGTWYFMTAVITPTSESVYVNGTLTLSDPLGVENQGTGGMQIGYGNVAGQFLNGSATNIQIYNTTLSAANITALYNGGIYSTPIDIDHLVGWWPLNGNPNDYGVHGLESVATNVVYTNTYYIPFFGYNISTNASVLSSIARLYTNGGGGFSSILLRGLENSSNAGIMIGNTFGPSVSGFATFNPALGSRITNINVRGINTTTGGYNTVSFWMRWNGTAGIPFGFSAYDLYFGSGCLGFSTGAGDVYGTSFTPLIKKWVFVTAEFYNGAYTGNSLLYLNGVPQTLTQCAAPASSGGATNSIYVSGWGLTGNYYNGSITNVQIYNTTLSAVQAQHLYQEGIGGAPVNTQNLVMWWPLEGNSRDYSGRYEDGIPSNVAYGSSAYLPATLQNAYQISRAAVPMAVDRFGNSERILSIYNVSVLEWR